MRPLALIALVALAACEPYQTGGQVSAPPPTRDSGPQLGAAQTVSNFRAVVAQVEPIAERECRARTKGMNCDFNIIVDPDPKAPANAYQTVDKAGRPVIGFTQALIADARNRDELAFVLGHEAAHHILGHLASTQQSAMTGAVLGAVVAGVFGLDGQGAQTVSDLGAGIGARTYSKSYELGADRLGTVIAYRAGYNPVKGAEFFTRLPDPGDRFLGTHPPNADRIATVRQTMAGL